MERPAERPPRLAEGMELSGEYEGSGYKEAHYLARRSDGHMVQLSELLFLVADECDGERSYDQVGERVSERFGRNVSGDNVRTLVEDKLRPLGVLADADGSSPEVTATDPLLALKFRKALVNERAVGIVTGMFRPLFWPPVVLAGIVGFIALDVWLFAVHGVAQGLRETLYQPAWFLAVLGLVVLSAAFHEIGHASGAAYGGAKPGVMGAGLYLVWPAFYTDVTDAYRLNKGGRLRTDLGGLYFNALFCLATFGAYLATGAEPLLLVIMLQQVEMAHQLLPFLRLDGYYIVSDLVGVPDLFLRLRPILASLRPGKSNDRRVDELKPWVRLVVTLWVLLVIPILLFQLAMLLVHLPRVIGTAWDASRDNAAKVSDALADGKYVDVAVGAAQIGLLMLPMLGIVVLLWQLGSRIARGSWSWSSGRPVRRAVVVAGWAALLATAVITWWPNDRNYQPIQEGETGTVFDAVAVVGEIPERVGEGTLVDERAPLGVDAEPDGAVNDPEPVNPTPGPGATTGPSSEPTAEPSFEPTAEPTFEPTSDPTSDPVPSESGVGTPEPTFDPTATPSP